MATKKNHISIVISGGGTGGHVYPAIAIADAVKALDAKAEVLFVGAQGRMEMEKVPQAGYAIKGLWISGLQRKLTAQNLLFPVKLLHSSLKALGIINRTKPDVAIGVGGYASGPLLRMASLKGVPTLLQEQNGYAGLTNKLLAPKAKKICVAYPNMEKYFPKEKIVFTGNPVRTDMLNLSDMKEEAFAYYKLNASKPTLLVFGGSLGARTFNDSMADGINRLIEAGFQVIWQTGKNNYEAIHRNVSNTPKGLVMVSFIEKMQYAYACASVVVARAGALSISELCLAKKATILVPSPNVAEDHQTKNAMALFNENAAELVKDNEAKDTLIEKALALLNDEARRATLEENIAKFGKPQAATDIAKEIFKLAKKPIENTVNV